jgi:uncharacterized membrane protein
MTRSLILGLVGDLQTESSLETHGFIYDGVSFTTIDVPGSSVTVAHGINNAGDIVGRFHNAVEGGYGFLYTRGKFTTINIPGSIGSGAYGINDRGQIVGTFADASATGAHGFIATPVPTAPPVISITATPASLWPPNGKLIPVTVSGTITDEDSDVSEITAAYEVIDEYGLIQRNGAVTVQADGSYIFTVPLRALRNDTDTNGRQYTITVRAFDNADNEGSAATSVIVPHHQGQSIAAQ